MPPVNISRAFQPSEFNPDPHAPFRQSLDAPGGTSLAKDFLDKRLQIMDREGVPANAQGRAMVESALRVNDPELLNLTARYFTVPIANKKLGTPEQLRSDVQEIVTNIQNGNVAQAKEHLKVILSLADPTFKDTTEERANPEAEGARTPLAQTADLAAPGANAHAADMRLAGPAVLPPMEIAAAVLPAPADAAAVAGAAVEATEKAPGPAGGDQPAANIESKALAGGNVTVVRDAGGKAVSATIDDGKTKRQFELDGDSIKTASFEQNGTKYEVDREKSGNGGYDYKVYQLGGTPDEPTKKAVDGAYVRKLSLDLGTGEMVATYNGPTTDRYNFKTGVVEYQQGNLTGTKEFDPSKPFDMNNYNRNWRTVSMNGKSYTFDEQGFKSVEFEKDGQKVAIERADHGNLDIYTEGTDGELKKAATYGGSISVDPMEGTVKYKFDDSKLDGPNGDAIRLLRAKAGLVAERAAWNLYSSLREPKFVGSDLGDRSVAGRLKILVSSGDDLNTAEKAQLGEIMQDPKRKGELLERVLAEGAVNGSPDVLAKTVRGYMGTGQPDTGVPEKTPSERSGSQSRPAGVDTSGADLSQLGLGGTDMSGEKAETTAAIQQRMEAKLSEMASTTDLLVKAHDPDALKRELGITEDQLKQMTSTDRVRLGEELKGKLAGYGIAAELLPRLVQSVFGG